MATTHEHTYEDCFDCKHPTGMLLLEENMYIVYVTLISMHAHVLRSLLTVTSKHDGSDSTALPNENGQLGVGLLQINIVASNKLNSLYTKKTH